MLRDFAVFLRALWREWKTLLTGGSIVALIALGELTGHKAFPNSVNWLILGFTFVVAAFLSWREEWITSGRGVIEADFERINRLFEGRTGAQTRELIRPYMGKRCKIRATLRDFSHSELVSWQTFIHLQSGTQRVSIMFFRWNSRLSGLAMFPIGTEVEINGRITTLERGSVWLGACRITIIPPEVSVHPTPDPQSPPTSLG